MKMSAGNIVEILISDFGVNGEGIGKHGDFIVFVENAVPGDVVLAKLYNIKKSYGFGEIVEIKTYSESRQEPKCGAFGVCGGCRFLHVDYETELKFKKKKVNDALKRIGGLNFEIDEIIGMDTPYYYRNKAVYHVSSVNGKAEIGFYGARSKTIAPVLDCVMFGEEFKRITDAFMVYMNESRVLPYDVKTGKGLIKALMVRQSSHTGDILVSVSAAGSLPNTAGLVYHLTEAAGQIKGITLCVSKDKNAPEFSGKMKYVWGDGFIIDKIGDYKFKVSAGSFFQVNPVMTPILYEKAAEYAALSKNDAVLDAYAGTGAISIMLSGRAGSVIGVELNPLAVRDAEENAKLNGITNVRFIEGDVADVFDTLIDDGLHPNTVILDPPRSGCGTGVIKGLERLSPDKIVYVSCDPATLARDLRDISQMGYTVTNGVCVDMFAGSAHVECVVKMSKI